MSPCHYGTPSEHTRYIKPPLLYPQLLELLLRCSAPTTLGPESLILPSRDLRAKVYQLRQLWIPQQMSPVSQGLTQRSLFLAKTNGDVWWVPSKADSGPGFFPSVSFTTFWSLGVLGFQPERGGERRHHRFLASLAWG